MSLLLELSPLLLGALAFTAFIGLRTKNSEGTYLIKPIGYIFLGLGFAGMAGTLLLTVQNYQDSVIQDQKMQGLIEKADSISEQNLALERYNLNIEGLLVGIQKENSELVSLSVDLGRQIDDQRIQIFSLIEANKVLVLASKRSVEGIGELQDQNNLIEQHERSQARSADQVVNIMKEEEDRRQTCLRLAKRSGTTDNVMRRRGCADFITPSAGRCRGYSGVGGPCYDGVGGPLYDGVGGPCYDGVGGACYEGIGGSGNCPAKCG